MTAFAAIIYNFNPVNERFQLLIQIYKYLAAVPPVASITAFSAQSSGMAMTETHGLIPISPVSSVSSVTTIPPAAAI